MKYTLLLATLLVFPQPQQGWVLKNKTDNILIYTRDEPGSRFDAIRVTCELTATLSQFVSVIMDVNAGAEWVYSTKSSVLLKQVSPSELFYYSEVNLPWPITNRDFIAHLTVSQDPISHVVTIKGPTVNHYLPEKKNIVRVAHSEGLWVITPLPGHKVSVEYTLITDPGGSLPAWMVNLFATKGPLESFKKLAIQLRKPVYASAHLPFIQEL
jgi:hypothetical protein